MHKSAMNMLSIGQMAKLNQVSVETLRHYERIGLIKPYYINEDTNYRYYSIEQSAKLDFIANLKRLGLSLVQIKEVFERNDMQQVQSLLNERLEYFDIKINELSRTRYTLKRSIDSISAYNKAPKGPKISIEHIPPREIMTFKWDTDFYNQPVSEFEYALRYFKKSALKYRLPAVCFRNIGDIVRKNALSQDRLICYEVFVFIDQALYSLDKIEVNSCLDANIRTGVYNQLEANIRVETLPESDYACIYFDDYRRKMEFLQRLLDYICDNGLTITGDCICEIIADLPFFKENDRKLLIKAQIPFGKL